ncbi:MAG TPA: autotransporter-associated beta strand repeat-containing protein, partial [Pseudomonadales bacterium]|nr:autotransporter-associated beta strand repeat-containing protein [Pseudomonadales bacterium]
MLALVGVVGATAADAGPNGGQVTAGTGTIEQAGSTTTIDQSSNKLAINWQSFDIGAGESVRFNQPSAQAIALNRILGQDPTTILGSLSANGQVFLLNPNGVLFGAGSQVDVGGIFASTQSISDSDFLAGHYTFAGSGADGSVLNLGTIRAAEGGYVALGGTNVVNDGVIRAYKGTVALGAGDQITLNLDGNRLVGFNVDKSAVAALVANKQLIQADGGTVLLSARAKDALLATVVNNDGIVEARSVENVGGVIRLDGGASGVVAVTGTLDATGANVGERGGDVTVTGAKVALLDGATIDASGRAGGGTVLVGGDTHGANADVPNAERTFVASSATLRADAIDAGDGGKVVVWADGDTRYSGSISAKGGATGGDGGFVEVSGKQQLDFAGAVDTSAPNGNVGTLLLDPNDLYISAAAVGGALQDSSNPFQSIDGVNNYYVLASTLTGLPATTAVQLQANHDIIFQTNLAMPTTAAGSLTFNASNGIQMGGFDLTTANGSVAMTAGAGGITNLGTINLGTGTLTLNSSGAIGQNAGDVIAGATAVVKQGVGTLTLSGANTYTGATTLNAGTIAVTANNGLGTNAGGTTVASGATLDLRNVAYGTAEGLTLNGGTLATSTGTSSFAGNIGLGANSIVNVGGTQLTTLGVISGATFGIAKQGAGVLLLSGNNTYTGTTSISAGTLRLSAANRIADTSAVLVGSGATFDLNNFAETVGSLAGAGTVTLGSATLTAGGDNTSTNFSGAASGTGGLTKAGTGTLTLSGANSFTGATTINGGVLRASGGAAIADTSQVSLANTAGVALDVTSNETIGNLTGGGAAGGNVTLNGNTLTVNEAGSTTYSGIASGTGGITKQGTGTLTLSGANTYTGTTTVTAGSLALGANNVLANGSSLVVNGGTLALGTRSDTVAGVQLQSGSITSSSGVLTSTSNYDLQSGSVSAILGGAVALNKSTGGTVVLSGANTYTGATNVNAGTLQLGAANRVPNTSALTVASGATFDLNNFAETIGSIAGPGNITLGSAILTTGNDGTSTTFSGSISGTGGVTKTGAGTTTLSGTNTYTGATTISAGVLRASGGNAIADTSAVTLANTAGAALDLTGNETIGNLSGGGAAGGNVTLNGNTLTVNEAGSTTYSGIASGTGGIAKQGAGTLTLSGTNTYTGATTVGAGTVALGANNVLANGSSVVVNGGTLSIANRSDTVAGVQLQSGSITGTSGVLTSTSNFDLQSGTAGAILGGAVALNKSTGGTVVLSGANTYTGATNVNAGTLQLGAAARIPDTSAVTIAAGATFDLNNFTETVGSIAGAGNITLGAGILTAGGDGTSTTFSGSMSGTGGLTKAGAGLLTLSGNSTYSGATAINLGTLRASGGNAIGDASAVTLANAAG